MPSYEIRKPDHHWTCFEKHTLICLIARGIHVNGVFSPGDRLKKAWRRKPTAKNDWYVKRQVHPDFTGAFYDALRDSKEIPEWEIINMVLIILDENPEAVEMIKRRPGAPRITRALKKAFNRNTVSVGQKEYAMDNEEEEALRKKQDEMIQHSIESLLKDAGNNAGWNEAEVRLALGGSTAAELTASVAEGSGETPTASQDASLAGLDTAATSRQDDNKKNPGDERSAC